MIGLMVRGAPHAHDLIAGVIDDNPVLIEHAASEFPLATLAG